MKYIFTFLIALCATVTFGQSLPIDFDDTKDANFVGVQGSTFSVITDGTNKVGQIIGGTNQWSSNVGLVLDTWIDMKTDNKTITFEFYTSEAIVMNGLLQLGKEKSGGYGIEMKFSTDGTIGYETVTLDFNGADNSYPNCQSCPEPKPVVFGEYARISLLANFGDTGTSTYRFDDIAFAYQMHHHHCHGTCCTRNHAWSATKNRCDKPHHKCPIKSHYGRHPCHKSKCNRFGHKCQSYG